MHSSDFYLNGVYNLDDGFYPATKEQRDLLFQKMNEAGYEWDAEHKQLKKINSVIKMKTPEESLGIDSDTYNKIVDECIYGDGNKNPAWSEDDEKNLEKTIWYVEKGGKLIFAKLDKLVFWLKSLKDRVQPQPKQEWSEEDNIILSRIIADYERSNEEWFKAQNSLPHGRKITWLKSLKDRYT